MQTRELQLAVWTRRRRRRDDRSKPLCYRRFTRAKLSNRLVVRTTPDLLPGENGDVRPQRWSEAAPPGLSYRPPCCPCKGGQRTGPSQVRAQTAGLCTECPWANHARCSLVSPTRRISELTRRVPWQALTVSAYALTVSTTLRTRRSTEFCALNRYTQRPTLCEQPAGDDTPPLDNLCPQKTAAGDVVLTSQTLSTEAIMGCLTHSIKLGPEWAMHNTLNLSALLMRLRMIVSKQSEVRGTGVYDRMLACVSTLTRSTRTKMVRPSLFVLDIARECRRIKSLYEHEMVRYFRDWVSRAASAKACARQALGDRELGELACDMSLTGERPRRGESGWRDGERAGDP